MKAELCTLFLFLSMFISMGLSSPAGESLSSPKLEGKIIYTIEFDEIFVIQSGKFFIWKNNIQKEIKSLKQNYLIASLNL